MNRSPVDLGSSRGALREVPYLGEFFDVNPGKLRSRPSPYRSWMRFSFGPPLDNMEMGLDRLAEMLREA